MSEDSMRAEGEARKARSIARLKAEGVPTIEHLPWIECNPETIQPLETIARRATVISLLAVYAETNGMPRDVLDRYLDARGVRTDLTANELKFLALSSPPERVRGPFTWQYECANVLLWAMGFVEQLGPPTTCCTAAGVSSVVAKRTVDQLISEAKPRSPSNIFDECDLIFRYHWAARDAELNGKSAPARLITPVCFYRHYALNWLTSAGMNWDDVDTST